MKTKTVDAMSKSTSNDIDNDNDNDMPQVLARAQGTASAPPLLFLPCPAVWPGIIEKEDGDESTTAGNTANKRPRSVAAAAKSTGKSSQKK